MSSELIVVLDVGKTLAKLSLWTPGGELVARASRANEKVSAGAYTTLDAAGVEAWIGETLSEFAKAGRVGAIVPVAHGAAAAIVRDGELAAPPLDYEAPIPATERSLYDAQRDPFRVTGSPALPAGLNLGAQLHHLEALRPGLLDGEAQILLWPQYWSWRLSGVAASEVTSLGCHSDLWRPQAGAPSELAQRRGWAAKLPPLAHAGDVLGPLSKEWVRRTGLPAGVKVHCGLHDSNAALLAARGFPEVASKEATVLSTGTWFVAMRSPLDGETPDIGALVESRDCLVNVDAYGKLIPSARFMGGREIEILTAGARRIDLKSSQPALAAAAAAAVAGGSCVLPSFAPGVGPFPRGRGEWRNAPADPDVRSAAVGLYAALMADASLDLIGARDHILVEGRFAEAEIFVRGLAGLRPHDRIYVARAETDVSFGALRLLHPELERADALGRVEPLPVALNDYRTRWRREAEQREATQ